MKHRLHIAILTTLVALWSCTSVEVDPTPGKRVTFSVGSYVPQTKAVSLNSEGITTFSSKGYLYAEGIDHVQDFFVAAGETITYNPSTPEWSPSRTYYWPKSSQSYVNFVSWYDKNGQPATATQTAMSWVIDGSTPPSPPTTTSCSPTWHGATTTTPPSMSPLAASAKACPPNSTMHSPA